MGDERTTMVVQRYLDDLDGQSPADPIIRGLLDKAVSRLHQLCAAMLHRSYPRLTQPPLNLQSDEMLSAVVERLLKALRKARPGNVRQFFALACQHMRWELNDLARRLDEQPAAAHLSDDVAPSPLSSSSGIGTNGRRILDAIGNLPELEREAFDLVKVQGMSAADAAQLIGVSTMTIRRRLNRSVQVLSEALADLRPAGSATEPDK
jgi:RNA polymerase sigma factor (sigma-70 family)